MQTDHVLRFAPETWDRLAESGTYAAILGAESGDMATLSAVHEPMGADDNVRAAVELERRGKSDRTEHAPAWQSADSGARVRWSRARLYALIALSRYDPRSRP